MHFGIVINNGILMNHISGKQIGRSFMRESFNMKVVLGLGIVCLLGTVVVAQEVPAQVKQQQESDDGWGWFQSDSSNTRQRQRSRTGGQTTASGKNCHTETRLVFHNV